MSLRTTGEFIRGPGQLTEVMRGFPRPWYVVGGWALDLYLDRITRPHQGIDIAVFRRDQSFLAAQFRTWRMSVIEAGQSHDWTAGQLLVPPRSELRAERPVTASATELTRLTIHLLEGAQGLWTYPRVPDVTLEQDLISFEAPAGLPALIPELVLLFKAGDTGPKAEQDFATMLPELELDGIDWLKWAINTAHPGHPWVQRLDDAGGFA